MISFKKKELIAISFFVCLACVFAFISLPAICEEKNSQKLIWKMESFTETSTNNKAIEERLRKKISDHLSDVGYATDVRLLISPKNSGGVVATLIYRLDTEEHHYAVQLSKSNSTGNKDLAELKADVEQLLNTPNVIPCVVLQETFYDEMIFGVIAEMK